MISQVTVAFLSGALGATAAYYDWDNWQDAVIVFLLNFCCCLCFQCLADVGDG